MTKRELDKYFAQHILPSIQKQERQYLTNRSYKDIPLRCEAYNNLLDSLCREGQLTDKQASTYCIPRRYL